MNELEYNKFIVPYRSAMRIIVAQLENIQYDYKLSDKIRNPIDTIYHRIKTYDSAIEKCARKKVQMTELYDIAGIRIICLYKDDIWRVRDIIKNLPGVFVQETKDYISEPKKNGYESLHLLTSVETVSSEGNKLIPVEFQIRTANMQAWSQMEHRAKYKARVEPTDKIARKIQRASVLLRQADELFVEIRRALKDD